MNSVVREITKGVAVSILVHMTLITAEAAANKIFGNLEDIRLDCDLSELYEDKDVRDSSVEEEISRSLSLFMTRYSAAKNKDKKAMSYKDMLCAMCYELTEIAPRLEDTRRVEVEKFISFVEKGLCGESSLELIAREVFKQIGGEQRKLA